MEGRGVYTLIFESNQGICKALEICQLGLGRHRKGNGAVSHLGYDSLFAFEHWLASCECSIFFHPDEIDALGRIFDVGLFR